MHKVGIAIFLGLHNLTSLSNLVQSGLGATQGSPFWLLVCYCLDLVLQLKFLFRLVLGVNFPLWLIWLLLLFIQLLLDLYSTEKWSRLGGLRLMHGILRADIKHAALLVVDALIFLQRQLCVHRQTCGGSLRWTSLRDHFTILYSRHVKLDYRLLPTLLRTQFFGDFGLQIKTLVLFENLGCAF